MKYRLDFVTNSSSSSFIISQSNNFTQEQKEIIANILISKLFSGSKVINTEEKFLKWVKDEYNVDFDVNEFIDKNGNFLFDINNIDFFLEEYYSKEYKSFIHPEFLEQILYALYDFKHGKVIITNNLKRDEYLIEELMQDFLDELDDGGNNFRIISSGY